MIYTANITTPKNTPATALKRTVLSVTKGLVYRVEIHFPPGAAGLAGVAIFDGGFQLWPSTIGDFFVSDDETIGFDDMYQKAAAPWQLDVLSYNTDDTYDHFIGVRIGLVSKEVFMARWLPTMGYDYFSELLDKMAAAKEQQAAEQAAQLEQTPFQWLTQQLEAME